MVSMKTQINIGQQAYFTDTLEILFVASMISGRCSDTVVEKPGTIWFPTASDFMILV